MDSLEDILNDAEWLRGSNRAATESQLAGYVRRLCQQIDELEKEVDRLKHRDHT